MSLEVLPIAIGGAFGATSIPPAESLISLGLYAVMATGLIAFLLIACRLIGRKTHSRFKDQPYESGVDPTGPAQPGRPVPFYLVAIFFIVFDVEVVFISSWAVAYDLLGWSGFLQILFFIVILFFGLVYLWAEGALDWGPARRQHRLPKEGR
jgi:NADH-quinone oxidoreductase subunit A